MQRRLEEHSSRDMIIEFNSRQYQVSQRERDRKWRVNAFTANLFNIESVTHDIFKHRSNLCPSLTASSFGRSIPNMSTDQTGMESSETYVEDDLCPLLGCSKNDFAS